MKPYPYLFAVAALSATLTHAHLLPPASIGTAFRRAPHTNPTAQPTYCGKRCTSIWITVKR